MVSEGSPHIRRGYRLGLSFSQCLRSMFQLHNETINVWSHLAGAILFVCLVFYVKDSSAFERPRAMVESVVGSIPFQGRFNVSIFEEEFCGPDDGAEQRVNASNWTAAHEADDTGEITQKPRPGALLLKIKLTRCRRHCGGEVPKNRGCSLVLMNT
jgi:hypothetical protein